MNYIIDLFIVLFILLLVFQGAHRGLVLTLCGLVAIFVAFFGASITANHFAPAVTELVEPHISNVLEAELGEALGGHGDSDTLLQALTQFGLYEDLALRIEDVVSQRMTSVSTSLLNTLSQAVAESVSYYGIFLVSFAIILLIWAMISRALDLVVNLPILNELNVAGGAIIGFFKACIFLFVVAWLVQYLGHLIPQATVEETYLLKFFILTNPFDLVGL